MRDSRSTSVGVVVVELMWTKWVSLVAQGPQYQPIDLLHLETNLTDSIHHLHPMLPPFTNLTCTTTSVTQPLTTSHFFFVSEH